MQLCDGGQTAFSRSFFTGMGFVMVNVLRGHIAQ
jgi:hypothetical protein